MLAALYTLGLAVERWVYKPFVKPWLDKRRA